MRAFRVLVICSLLAATAGCSWLSARDAAQKRQQALAAPLNSLAEQGDVEAMGLVADIEVLRAQGVFSDSSANALGATPAGRFLTSDDKGFKRAEVGKDISTLLDYSAAEPLLLKESTISEADATELRRLANYNTAAAAELAVQLKGRKSSAPQ